MLQLLIWLYLNKLCTIHNLLLLRHLHQHCSIDSLHHLIHGLLDSTDRGLYQLHWLTSTHHHVRHGLNHDSRLTRHHLGLRAQLNWCWVRHHRSHTLLVSKCPGRSNIVWYWRGN